MTTKKPFDDVFPENGDFSAIAILWQLICCSKWCFPMPLAGSSRCYIRVFLLMIFQQVVRNLFFFGSLEGCFPDLPSLYYSVSCFKIHIYLDVSLRNVGRFRFDGSSLRNFCPWVNASILDYINVGSRCHHLKNGETPFGWGFLHQNHGESRKPTGLKDGGQGLPL